MILGELIAIILLAYLIGSIPFGVIVGKLLAGVDPRDYGSGRTGGTNVMRVLGTRVGLFVIALDAAKGACAVLLAASLFGSAAIPFGDIHIDSGVAGLFAALAVISGHNWPVFLRFRGGRGVATFFGALLPIAPAAAIFGVEVLAIVAISTRYMSAGSIAGAFAAWLILILLTLFGPYQPLSVGFVLLATTLVLYQHRDNIDRLRDGIERQLGERVATPSPSLG